MISRAACLAAGTHFARLRSGSKGAIKFLLLIGFSGGRNLTGEVVLVAICVAGRAVAAERRIVARYSGAIFPARRGGRQPDAVGVCTVPVSSDYAGAVHGVHNEAVRHCSAERAADYEEVFTRK